ncbi:MAG: hypothetical protein DHS20C01_29120 [marine bacterium B5-7]|nr:MAG: hypothetical protein DHS20C01_29120 [marine bacterium B5-7]
MHIGYMEIITWLYPVTGCYRSETKGLVETGNGEGGVRLVTWSCDSVPQRQ